MSWWVPYTVGISMAYGHLIWQIHTAELDNPTNRCISKKVCFFTLAITSYYVVIIA